MNPYRKWAYDIIARKDAGERVPPAVYEIAFNAVKLDEKDCVNKQTGEIRQPGEDG